MSIPYEATGRTQQKSRTRTALVDAARKLVSAGALPTVEETAAEASISRTTAYRYFPNQRVLLAEAYPFVEMVSLLGDDAPDDVFERLEIVLSEHLRFVVANEVALRAALRIALEPDDTVKPLLRQGRAVVWIGEALLPLREGSGGVDVDRLAKAIRAVAGVEPLIWLTDVAGYTREDAIEQMKWSARALLQAALEEARS